MTKDCAKRDEIKGFCFTVLLLSRLNHLTDTQMMEILNISASAWRALERGELLPEVTVETIFRIETYFGLPAYRQFDPMNISFPDDKE